MHLPDASFQPIAAADVADAVVEAALRTPANETIEIAGPDRLPMSELIERYLKATNDAREVVRDPQARYFGARLDDRSLVPDDAPRLGRISLTDWIRARRREVPAPARMKEAGS